VADVLRTNIRTVDWVARYGGEEFCVVMPETSQEEALPVANRLHQALKEGSARAVDGREIRLTGSFGVAELNAESTPSHTSAVTLIQSASDRVREAKENGRDQVRY
jgi:two-component system cell cycle response regulator